MALGPGRLEFPALRAGLSSAAPPALNGGEWRRVAKLRSPGTIYRAPTEARAKCGCIFSCQRAFGSRQESGRHLLVVNTLADCKAHAYWPLVQGRRPPVLFDFERRKKIKQIGFVIRAALLRLPTEPPLASCEAIAGLLPTLSLRSCKTSTG